MRTILLAFVCLSLTAPVVAQTGIPTSWVLRIYSSTGAQVGAPVTVTPAQLTCDQAPPAQVFTDNPDRWLWPDPARATRRCVYVDTDRLAALADGAYEGTIQAVNADGPAAESARIPFTRRRPNPPAAVTGGQIIR